MDLAVVGTVLSLISVIATVLVSLVLYFLQRQRKSLAYSVILTPPILALSNVLKDKVQVLYEGHAVTSIYQALLRFENDGTIPIEARDYELPITIDIQEEPSSTATIHRNANLPLILSASIIEKEPLNLTMQLSVESQKIILSPALLNKGDWVLVQILTSTKIDQTIVNTRISGIRELRGEVWQDNISRSKTFRKRLVVAMDQWMRILVTTLIFDVISLIIPRYSSLPWFMTWAFFTLLYWGIFASSVLYWLSKAIYMLVSKTHRMVRHRIAVRKLSHLVR